MPDKSLKQRLREGEDLTLAQAPMNASKEELDSIVAQSAVDMLSVDAQHAPFNEESLVSFCASAVELDIPVHLRIKHTRHAFLIGNYLDLGPMAIMVPQVESEATVDEAVDAFYYPPLGKRSWGPQWGFGFDDSRERLEYAAWWNETGILVLQLESVNAVTNAGLLARPGVDMFAFGANDLNFSLEAYPDHPLKTVEDCIAHVEEQMAGTRTKVLR